MLALNSPESCPQASLCHIIHVQEYSEIYAIERWWIELKTKRLQHIYENGLSQIYLNRMLLIWKVFQGNFLSWQSILEQESNLSDLDTDEAVRSRRHVLSHLLNHGYICLVVNQDLHSRPRIWSRHVFILLNIQTQFYTAANSWNGIHTLKSQTKRSHICTKKKRSWPDKLDAL